MRHAQITRESKEAQVQVTLNLDGTGQYQTKTGLNFLDHLLGAWSFHSKFDLDLRAKGDVEVDDHHLVEDVGLALGQAVRQALGDVTGLVRFGWAYAPMDEALARAVVDVSNRPFLFMSVPLARPLIGDVSAEMFPEFFRALTTEGRITLHLEALYGSNDHHKLEAAFKACGLALKMAVEKSTTISGVPSTKGVL